MPHHVDCLTVKIPMQKYRFATHAAFVALTLAACSSDRPITAPEAPQGIAAL
ncbi:MAG: hypothetical protein H0W30_05430 [Gemmatimonadaceae bacterium]|nr:hypothetical protein [Gemmatimonadaceae bacterium]